MKRKPTLEQLFPIAVARAMADQAIDKLPDTEPMTAFVDAWEAEYCRVAGGKSPFRVRK